MTRLSFEVAAGTTAPLGYRDKEALTRLHKFTNAYGPKLLSLSY